ncbi:MAG: DinB family protein [Silvibacterium sp.]
METAVVEQVGETQVYRQLVRTIHGVVRRCADGFSQEESLIQPEPEGNCLNWVVGHLLHVYDKVLPALGQAPVMKKDATERYARGVPALKGADGALEMTELMAAWDEAAKRVEAGLAGLTTEALDAPAPFSPSNNPKETMRSLMTTVFFHQSYHAGQAGLLRRIAGRPGAIG